MQTDICGPIQTVICDLIIQFNGCAECAKSLNHDHCCFSIFICVFVTPFNKMINYIKKNAANHEQF